MAKKTDVQVIPANQAPLKLEAFNLGDTFSADDVVTVVMTRAERHYRARIKDQKDALTAAEAAMKKAEKAEQEALQKDAKIPLSADEQAKVAKLTKALAALGIEVSEERQEKGKHYQTATFGSHGTPARVYLTLHLGNEDDDSTAGMIKLPIELTPAAAAAVAAHATAGETVAAMTKAMLELKQSLAELPAMARAYKANLVEMKLSSTEDGKALLDRLNAKLDADLAAGAPLLLGPKTKGPGDRNDHDD